MLLAAACIQLWDIPAIGEVIQDQARIFHELLKLQHICKWLQWCWLRLPHAHGAQSFKQGVGRLLGGCSCTCLFATGWLLGGRARLLAAASHQIINIIDHTNLTCDLSMRV